MAKGSEAVRRLRTTATPVGPSLPTRGRYHAQALSFPKLATTLESQYGKPSAIVLISAHWEADGAGVRRISEQESRSSQASSRRSQTAAALLYRLLRHLEMK